MRLKSIFISEYKNLKDFKLSFDGSSFIDVFVGKNGTGKSNFFEALIEIFRHLYEFDKKTFDLYFDYKITFEIDGQDVSLAFTAGALTINGSARKTIGQTTLPDNVLIYYSGHNNKVAQLIKEYEEAFSNKIKNANLNESRRFIGIGPDYKALLLSILLMQAEGNTAKEYIRSKLGINTIGNEVKLALQRPSYANSSSFDIADANSETDRYWKPEGITKDFLDRLTKCISTDSNEWVRTEGYLSEDDQYILYYDIEKIQTEFTDYSSQDLFRQFDNLKTLGMLQDISIAIKLHGDIEASIAYFSDGQFQSVYIYAITELFKESNCITLLDEPDSFLHPEWQFDFLTQIFEITDTAAKTNHVLMSSHSASTITVADESIINLFELDENKPTVTHACKADVIKSLSAGLITFSESEARLNIHHVLRNTEGSVLFAEGITDEMILETAWRKLYPNKKRLFEIQNAFGCGFMRNLMKDETLYRNNPGRTFFSIFDFDKAYNDWKQLGQDVQTDPHQCLVKRHNNYAGFALLLPVPSESGISNQVINPYGGGNYGDKSLMTIEHLFYGAPNMDKYFIIDTKRTDSFLKFVSDSQKVAFAKDVVPTIDAEHFEAFRPIFDFIESKIQTNENLQVGTA
ncbi:MAG: AAA family ATPase [Cycloclasticus sp.]